MERRPVGAGTRPAPRDRAAAPRGSERHPSTQRAHLRERLPADVARRRTVRSQLRGVAGDEFRPDVDGLRAVAVVAVVLFHLRLEVFAGGFVGVDVFFVLSGFLITRMLLKELSAAGTLSLPAFWARRARRLLPASFLVLVVTLAAGWIVLPPLAVRTLAVDVAASGGFVVNFVFASRFGDYFAAQLAAAQPSALLHYWSLAVEEQFYLLWPLVLVALTRRPRQLRRLLVVTIVALAAASVLLSVWMTSSRPTWAFYLLPARMGELLAGAALAVAGPAFTSVNSAYRAALGWFGILAIGVAVVTYDTGTAFPGTAAMLPVLGTVLVIVAGGAGASASGPILALRHPVALWIGRHSYALYLWHWPVLVLAEVRFGTLSLTARAALVALAVALSGVSVRLVEDPVRHAAWLAQRAGRSLALGAALCASTVLAGLWVRSFDVPLDSGRLAAAPTLAVAPTSIAPVAPELGQGPAAVSTTSTTAAALAPLAGDDLEGLFAANWAVLEQGLAQTDVPSNLRPPLRSISADRAAVYTDGCVAVGRVSELEACRYGVEGATTTIVLYGDSHAAQWFPALEAIAQDRNIELVVMIKGGCPVADVSIPTATLSRTCPIWRDQAVAFVAAEQPDVLVVSSSAGYPNGDEEWAAGLQATLSRLAGNAGQIVLVGDTPEAGREPADCLSRNLRTADRCAADRGDVASSRLDVERQAATKVGADFIDTTDWLCTERSCPMMIGDLLIYRDSTHITTLAAEWFRPLLEAELADALP